ncbi:MAG: hypothetical protein JST39_19870 [Bacteroidetes bacterium]|nr:hypothetical protein [Bacteroidota bacterium]
MSKKEHTNPDKGKIQPVKEDTKNRADLDKHKYPLPDIKDNQYDYQPEFIENNGNKQKKDKAE